MYDACVCVMGAGVCGCAGGWTRRTGGRVRLVMVLAGVLSLGRGAACASLALREPAWRRKCRKQLWPPHLLRPRNNLEIAIAHELFVDDPACLRHLSARCSPSFSSDEPRLAAPRARCGETREGGAPYKEMWNSCGGIRCDKVHGGSDDSWDTKIIEDRKFGGS